MSTTSNSGSDSRGAPAQLPPGPKHPWATFLRTLPEGARWAPTPHRDPVVGNLRQFRGNRLEVLLKYAHELGDVARFEVPGRTFHLLSHPDHVRYVLQEGHKRFSRFSRGLLALRYLLGNGLLTTEGSLWLRQRRIAQPAFHRQRIAGLGARMVAATLDMRERWSKFESDGTIFDVGREMRDLTLRIVIETLLGATAPKETEEIAAAMDVLLEVFIRRASAIVPLPSKIPTPLALRARAARGTLDRIIGATIAERRRRPGDGDLLSMLMAARDEETGEAMSDEQLRDEAMTIFTAGHETTANALAFAWYLLATHPVAARTMQSELVTVLAGREATFEDLGRLEYTRCVVQEALRLYPPALQLARIPLEDETVGGFHIPAGTTVLLSPWVTHRHHEFWDHPAAFDPERFRPERSVGRHPFAYFPFGGGPRICIGNNFAMAEAQLILATLARDFELELVPGFTVRPQPALTLRPKDGVWVRARRVRAAGS